MTDFSTVDTKHRLLIVDTKHEPVLLFFIYICNLNIKIPRAKTIKVFGRPLIKERIKFQMGHWPHWGRVQVLHLPEELVAEIQIRQTVETGDGSPESEKFIIEKL